MPRWTMGAQCAMITGTVEMLVVCRQLGHDGCKFLIELQLY